MNSTEIWIQNWGKDIDTTDKEFFKSKEKDLAPQILNFKEGVAFFKVKEHGYAVSLSNCQCDYFQKQNKPCRHIYRLARELGIPLVYK